MLDHPTVLLKFVLDEDVSGEVVGRLTSDGAYVEAIDAAGDGQVEIIAKLPVEAVQRIEKWFPRITDGKGKMLRPAVGGETTA